MWVIGSQVRLRTLLPDDYATLWRWSFRPGPHRGPLAHRHQGILEDPLRDFSSELEGSSIVLVLDQDQAPLGYFWLREVQPWERLIDVEMALFCDEPPRHMKEAWLLFLDALFRWYPIQIVHSSVPESDQAQLRILDRAGFDRHGVSPESRWVLDHFEHRVLVSLTREVWTAEVAKALSIREDTLRRLARNSQVPFDPTPSGRRLFNIDEVKSTLAARISRGRAMREHSIRDAWLVDATELDGWAERRDCQQDFPLAIRILIAASTRDISEIDFRTGEGVNLAGWDGRVLTDAGTPWIPAGASGWELGTDEDILRKANSDYDARTADSLGLDPLGSTFVFATPRRWPGRDQWIETKRAEGKWADVQAFDADSIAAWLDENPGAHARITKLVGRDPDNASDVRTAWERWSQRSQPALPTTFLTAGREDQAQKLLNWLSDEPGCISVVAESVEEGLAFTLASLDQAPEGQRDVIEGRGLVVRTLEAWSESLRRAKGGMILIPLFDGVPTADAVQAGHHVVVPSDKNSITKGECLELSRLRTAPATEALVAIGLERRPAEKLAVLARRSLIMARRRMSADAAILRPAWATAEAADPVIAALFAGGWRDDRDGDKQVLSRLSHASYEEFATALSVWLLQPDPPLRRVGALWFITSKEDAWELTARFVTSAQLERLSEAVIKVLAAVDPALELDVSQRWSAALYGKVSAWSDSLRLGLAETLAVIASRSGDAVLANRMTGQAFADVVVREVLKYANDDVTGSIWKSLDEALRPLAEASPTQFLAGVDAGIAKGAVAPLFDPDAEQHIFGRASHTNLLWALECLAWSADHLPEAAVVLTKLAAMDPGGRWSNRPSASLRDIFLPWLPHTTMPLDSRIAVLKRLRTVEPPIGWSLTIDLLPSGHEWSSGTSRPKWREWAPEDRIGVTVAEFNRTVEALTEDLIKEAGDSAERWADLVQKLGSLPPEQHEAVVIGLGRIDPEKLTETDLYKLTAKLRDLVQHHESYPKADWALPADRVAKLRAELERLEASNLVIASVWLFKHHALFVYYERDPNSDRALREGETKLAEAQLEAVKSVLNAAGLDSLFHLAELAETPWSVGIALAHVRDAKEDDIIQRLDAEHPAHRRLASGFAQTRFREAGWDWSNPYLQQAKDWPPERIAAFLLAHPVQATVLDLVESFNDEVQRLYWSSVVPYGVTQDVAVRVARSLVDSSRPASTLMIIQSNPVAFDSPDGTDLTIRALTEAAHNQSGENPAMFSFYVEQLLTRLNSIPDLERTRLAQLEWLFLPLFEHGDRQPVVLHDELRRSPQFFVEVVSWVYRAEGEPPEADQSEEASIRARLGYSLLHTWRTPPPIVEEGDLPALAEWISTARRLCADRGRNRIGDQCIGHLLRYTAPEPDGAWPNKVVCDIIEDARSTELEEGIEVEVFNSRGVTTRDPYAGGTLERALVDQYKDYAERLGFEYSRTKSMLSRIADNWAGHARMEDMESELREDLAD